MMQVAVALLLLCLTGAYFAAPVMSRLSILQRVRTEHLNSHSKAFFKATADLLDDETTSDVQREWLSHLVWAVQADLRCDAVCLSILKHVATPSPAEDEEFDQIMSGSARVRKDIVAASTHGMLAITYRSRRYGQAVRAMLADNLDNPVKTVPIASRVKSVQIERSNVEMACAALA